MDLQVGVKIILQNSEGKILLLQRNLDKYTDIDKREAWDIVGGRINPGSPLIENLKREIYEETKLELKDEPKLIYAQDILRPDKHVVRLTYRGKIEGEPQMDEEHKTYKWFTIEEIKKEESLDRYFKEVFGKLYGI